MLWHNLCLGIMYALAYLCCGIIYTLVKFMLQRNLCFSTIFTFAQYIIFHNIWLHKLTLLYKYLEDKLLVNITIQVKYFNLKCPSLELHPGGLQTLAMGGFFFYFYLKRQLITPTR
jgi:hypothetical protein